MAGKMSLEEYLNKLAAKTPSPGGGSAAALVGALGTALLAMTAKYALKKTKTVRMRKRAVLILKSSESASRRLRILMSADEKAYYRLAKELKKQHPKSILRLYKDAIDVPMEVCEIAAKSAAKCLEMCDYCKTSIISDAVEAAILCESSFLSAKMNVHINLCSIDDISYVNRICKKLKSEEAKIRRAKELVIRKAQKFLR
ncbi:MAG: cyclodeaminase/cyclohydrolase family protein [Candidatus Omnitrophica bacterium]|nr:cyclodeaminase/cyclohydrolase family protein [Candidatus Omnitrophota bacterium]